MFGGKVCPPLESSKPCNQHACVDAVCHTQHVRCKLNYVSYAKQPSGDETDAAKAGIARQSSCRHWSVADPDDNGTPRPLVKSDGTPFARADGSDTYNCHRCDTEFECQMKQINRVIEIIHDKRFSHVGYTKSQDPKFKCKIVDGRPASGAKLSALKDAYWLNQKSSGVPHDEVDHHVTRNGFTFRTSHKHKLTENGHSKCECRCTHHPTGCFRKNWMFGGDLREGQHAYIHGNIYNGIADKEACSNLCSHHPDCKLWEFDTNGKCILRTNSATEVTYVENPNSDITTYAGVSSHNSAACLFHDRPTLCPYGKYVWEETATEKKYCLNCPTGQYTMNGSNNDRCYPKADLEATMGPSAVYPDEHQHYADAEAGIHEDNHGTSTSDLHDAGPYSMTPW